VDNDWLTKAWGGLAAAVMHLTIALELRGAGSPHGGHYVGHLTSGYARRLAATRFPVIIGLACGLYALIAVVTAALGAQQCTAEEVAARTERWGGNGVYGSGFPYTAGTCVLFDGVSNLWVNSWVLVAGPVGCGMYGQFLNVRGFVRDISHGLVPMDQDGESRRLITHYQYIKAATLVVSWRQRRVMGMGLAVLAGYVLLKGAAMFELATRSDRSALASDAINLSVASFFLSLALYLMGSVTQSFREMKEVLRSVAVEEEEMPDIDRLHFMTCADEIEAGDVGYKVGMTITRELSITIFYTLIGAWLWLVSRLATKTGS